MTWTTRYLKCLQLVAEQPSFAFLQKITTAHLNQFPFENISKFVFHSKQKRLPGPEQFIQDHLAHHTGGTCYSLNTNLHALLESLGFQCKFLMLGEEHLAILVSFGAEHYYVDCGAAAPMFKPFLLHHDNKRSFGGDVIHITPLNTSQFEYKRYLQGSQTGKTWLFDRSKPINIIDFKQTIKDSFQKEAAFMRILRCQVYQLEHHRSVSLLNNQLTLRYQNGEVTSAQLHSISEVEEILAKEFNLPLLPVREAIKRLERNGHSLFSH